MKLCDQQLADQQSSNDNFIHSKIILKKVTRKSKLLQQLTLIANHYLSSDVNLTTMLVFLYLKVISSNIMLQEHFYVLFVYCTK